MDQKEIDNSEVFKKIHIIIIRICIYAINLLFKLEFDNFNRAHILKID